MALTCFWIKAEILLLLFTPLCVMAVAGLIFGLPRCFGGRRE